MSASIGMPIPAATARRGDGGALPAHEDTMLRRLIAPAFLAVAVLTSSPAPLPAQAPKPAPKTTSEVYYRSKGKPTWHLFGHYASEASAKQVFNHLASHGYEVELRVTTKPIPKVPARLSSGTLPASETVTYKQAVEVFNWMARQYDIAFRFPV